MAKVSDQLLEAIDWNRTFQRLVVYAHRRSGCRMPLSEAEDVAAKAICQFLDPEYADWDPERQTLLLKLGSIVNGLLRNRTRTKATSAVLAVDFMSSPVAVLAASESPGPETRAMDGSEARRAFKLLEEELKGDECGENVLLLECDGMTEPRMQAEALGMPIGTIYKARYRLGRARETVRRRMQSEELS